ncbi:hypothetical protein ACFQH3_12705 [Haladaptatus sp. GCM10025707]|uniref:hypothetical protein n=1 Tax=unclassified Haladaptatus TaxID=2622732 RepID=UPI0023E78518|nr:hypothetical protein [Haladaptatus sp. QDMS2]
MPSFITRVQTGLSLAQSYLALAVVPLLTALVEVEKLERIVAHQGFHIGFRFSVPADVVNLWTFVDVPNQGFHVESVAPAIGPIFLTLPATLLLSTVLSAGYFGSIAEALETGEYRFVSNVKKHFVAFLVYAIVPVVLVAPLLLLGGQPLSPSIIPVVLLLGIAFLVLGYLFYATPYLVVLRDTGLVAAARGAYGIAVDGGAFFRYTVGFVLFSVLLSAFASAFVVNLGVVGLLVGILVLAPVGLGLNIATMQLIADVDPHSPASVSLQDAVDGSAGTDSSTDSAA